MKGAIIWGTVILILVGTVFGVARLAKAPSSGPTGTIPEISVADQTRGPKDAKVVLVEYSDFQCPACGAFFPRLEDLNKELEGKILFIYRNFPLPQHKNAELAAYAAEAAGRQGKFWEMHSVLFEKQSEWSELANARETFYKYAESIGLDTDSFKVEISSGEVKAKISADREGGRRASVSSTPSFYLNGKKMEGYNSYDDFAKQVRDAVGK